MFDVYISNDYNLGQRYLQISTKFLAIVVKHLRYTACERGTACPLYFIAAT
jgi:hypothetical protein